MNQLKFVKWKPFTQTAYVEFPRQGYKMRYLKACIYVDKQILQMMKDATK